VLREFMQAFTDKHQGGLQADNIAPQILDLLAGGQAAPQGEDTDQDRREPGLAPNHFGRGI
jgi:hypothetical protein